jgi:hypothetical protein
MAKLKQCPLAAAYAASMSATLRSSISRLFIASSRSCVRFSTYFCKTSTGAAQSPAIADLVVAIFLGLAICLPLS